MDADVIILAGDIHVGMSAVRWAEQPLNQTLAHIVFICGNHEFYREDITKLRSEMNLFCRHAHGDDWQHRLHYLENSSVIIDGVRFLGATLWTGFQLLGEKLIEEAMFAAERSLNDFRLIAFDDRKFTAKDSMYLFN